VTNGSRLSTSSTTTHIYRDIQLTHLLDGKEGANDRFSMLISRAIFIVLPFVDNKLAAARLDTDASCTGLATTGGNKFFGFLGRAHRRIRLDRKWGGLLSSMGVFLTTVYTKFGQHTVSEFIFWKHSLHRVGDYKLRAILPEVFYGPVLFIAHVTRIEHVFFILFFGPSEFDFVCIDNDYIVASVNMRRVNGLIATTQSVGDLNSEPAQDLVRCVNNLPIVRNSFFFWLQ